jgi:hypothetical protein
LQVPPSGDVKAKEISLVSLLRSMYIKTDDDPKMEEKENMLAEVNKLFSVLGIDYSKLFLKAGNSILCYFICSSDKQLRELRSHYKSGLMQQVLEDVFTLLSNKDEKIVIRQLQWNFEDYCQSIQRVRLLNALG